jgi:hypothetical protein
MIQIETWMQRQTHEDEERLVVVLVLVSVLVVGIEMD